MTHKAPQSKVPEEPASSSMPQELTSSNAIQEATHDSPPQTSTSDNTRLKSAPESVPEDASCQKDGSVALKEGPGLQQSDTTDPSVTTPAGLERSPEVACQQKHKTVTLQDLHCLQDTSYQQQEQDTPSQQKVTSAPQKHDTHVPKKVSHNHHRIPSTAQVACFPGINPPPKWNSEQKRRQPQQSTAPSKQVCHQLSTSKSICKRYFKGCIEVQYT